MEWILKHLFVVVLLVVVRSFFVNRSPHWYLYVMCLLEDFVLCASHCLTLLLVCVYLPFDNGLYSGHFEFQETLDQLEGFIDSQDYDMLAVVGDFNVDFSHTDRRHTNDLLQFIRTNSLIAKDLDFPDVQFTYESDDGLWALGWIMY